MAFCGARQQRKRHQRQQQFPHRSWPREMRVATDRNEPLAHSRASRAQAARRAGHPSVVARLRSRAGMRRCGLSRSGRSVSGVRGPWRSLLPAIRALLVRPLTHRPTRPALGGSRAGCRRLRGLRRGARRGLVSPWRSAAPGSVLDVVGAGSVCCGGGAPACGAGSGAGAGACGAASGCGAALATEGSASAARRAHSTIREDLGGKGRRQGPSVARRCWEPLAPSALHPPRSGDASPT